MTNKREKATKVINRMLPPKSSVHLLSAPKEKTFGDELSQLAMSNVFEQLWTRDTIDVRTRSLVTIGILIALRASNELATHFPAAVRNGASLAEIEEVIYHASGYTGFPAAGSALRVAHESLTQAGMI